MGNIHIRAYGDFNSSEVDKEALNSTNISLHGSITELNTVGKNNRYKHFLMDLNDWVSANPPPVHLFLIFGSKEFSSSGILHRLRMCNYNILLACPGMPHVALCHAPTIMWDWSSLLKGEDLTGKHFNHPPDGPTNSRYGNSNVPLENPFSLVDFHTSSQNAEEIYKPTLDIKLCEASKSVSRQVMKILCSHPNGISIGDLRAELTKCDLPLDKRFYGNKKFSDFLVSMSYVQLQYLGGGNFWVRLVPSTTSDNDIVKSDDVNPEIMEKINPSKNPSTCNDCNMLQNKHEIPTTKEVDEVCCSPFTSTFGSWISSWWTFWRSNAKSEVYESASHFEESKSSGLQYDLCHPQQPYWDNFKCRVSVWWDFDSCAVPSDISFLNVAPSIMGVLRANEIKSPICIDTYGDVSQLSKIKQEALFLSGIDLHHIPGGKNKNKCLMDWLSQNPPRRHLFLIFGDKDFYFSGTLRRNDNFLLACPGKADGYICKVATIVWQWSSVLKGKYLTGKYFNHPPDWYIRKREQTPLEYPPEWYRNSKVPHENPFSAAEEPTSSQNAKILDPSSYIKLIYVQQSVSRKIRKVLSSYPNGISIGDLTFHLGDCFGRGLPDRKKLSNILASIPDVQLLYIGDDNFCVRLMPSTTSNAEEKNEQRDVNHSRSPVLFSTDSFWDEVESFVFTSRGSRQISRSTSREDLAHRLQKHGGFFKFRTKNKILQLVELLIAEKKWLEENPSQALPFRVTKSVQKS
ncbi:uncharacterized protein [Medicago truncatula]|uniref:uncharacterized protein isoform X2 n=1 Tax=Medicago truncatula TaxID=3880 RepID=UPI001966F649|nr:uncharacterized protein LOC25498900 isoform X2 [Medicago truncatula]